MKNRREIYDHVRSSLYNKLVDKVGHNKATRLSNIYAVKNTEKEYRKQYKSDKHNLVGVRQVFNRNKLLDEAIFLGVCGLNMCKDNQFITGVVRLEMARDKLDKTIAYINKEKLGK